MKLALDWIADQRIEAARERGELRNLPERVGRSCSRKTAPFRPKHALQCARCCFP